jgi:hypothetical protein
MKRQPAVLTLGELEIARVDRADVLGEHRGGIAGVASLSAIEGEAAHRMLESQLEQGTLVKVPAGALECSPSPSEHGEMGEPETTFFKRDDALREMLGFLAGGNRTARGVPAHPALMADPINRRDRALRFGFVGGGEDGGIAGEAELEEIDPVAEPDQAFTEVERGELARRRDERVDGPHELIERRSLVLAVTHFRIIEQTFGDSARVPAARWWRYAPRGSRALTSLDLGRLP